MTLEIREANVADAEAIAELNFDVQKLHAEALPWMFKQPSSNAGLAEEFVRVMGEPGKFILIASITGQAAGYISAEIYHRAESVRSHSHGMLYVHHISVRPEHRRMGVGRELLDAAKLRGRQAGVQRMALDVWTFNEDARRFFRKYGLENYNEKMWKAI